MLAPCKQDWRTHWGKWWHRLAGLDPEKAPKPQARRHEWKPDGELLGFLQAWFQVRAMWRGYEVEWVTVWWQGSFHKIRLDAVVRKDGSWLKLEAETYGETSEESRGSASGDAYARYTRLLDDADRYLAAGACRAMLKGRYLGVEAL